MDFCGGQTPRLSSPNFKTLHLVRHAQGIHNVELEENGELTPLSEEFFDARLSPKGLQQVSERRKEILDSGLLNTIELVITSPLHSPRVGHKVSGVRPTPIVIFEDLSKVRHAQGIHNVELEENGELTPLSEELFDARLSPKGLQQVSERRKEILDSGLLNTIELVITSPLHRTMQTSIGIFRGQEAINHSENFPKAHNFPPIIALEICRERMGLYPCDRRKSISTYRTCFSEIDFTMIESDEDALWQAEERENLEEVSARGLRFLKWLGARPEKEIAVVSHGIFLQQTLRALHGNVGIPLKDSLLTRFVNCELRSIRIREE